MLNIIFMGTPDFAEESLKCLVEAKHNILAVVTNPDKPQGRGMKLTPSPVKQYALEKGLKVLEPLKIRKNEEFINEIKSLNPDVICVVAYGKILPQEMLDIPKLGAINVHGSLLPKYRGSAPIQWAVINGDRTTGITTMYMDAGMDTGDIILKKEVEIGELETTGQLWDRLKLIGGKLLIDTLELIEQGKAPREKQTGEASLAPMLSKEIAKINWNEQTAKQIQNLTRGLNPLMGTYAYLNGKKIKFWKVKAIVEDELIKRFPELNEYKFKLKEVQPGTLLFTNPKQGMFVSARSGILEILEIQAENSKKMLIQDFLRGNRLEVGNILE